MQCGLPTLGRLHSWAAILLLLILGGQPASGAEDRELIAVLDLKGVRADEAETLALSDRLREEMLKSGQFILVDRSQMEALLDEQAFQQSGCTEQECAVQVGQILGVRKIVAGKVIRVSGDVWLVSGIMVDVESAQTIRAESVSHEGRFIDLMQGGVAGLARKLAGLDRAGPSQRAASAPHRQTVWKDPLTGIEFQFMAGGTYEQGCGAWTSQCNHDEKPVRWVTLGPFWIGRTEVTQAQWRKVMGANPSQYLGDDRPVEQVSWTDAQEFVRRLNTRSESGGETFRLLSEAEWEFACRSGGMPVAYGTRPGRLEYRYARYGAANGTVGVGLYPPNPLGLHDLSGNVWEWTQDAYDSRVYANGPAKDPVNVASASVKVLRGGGWSDDSVTLRCTYRGSADAHSRSTAIGIRLAMTR